MAVEFRDRWLERFYEQDLPHKCIPASLQRALYRKLQILDASVKEADLRIPPGNHFEYLNGYLRGWCSIRVNKQYRLIFQWIDGIAVDTYLNPHNY
ncbi:type II toxin-antitoxin system RelE/ParE family toxin [Photorhabdus antumapuensis]|uniref:type II toxin-antitoxin system RelE/ParE family toxin n=1 Tax=Photorhabdus antumapuensis TaxID=2862867 RepID=UPI001CECFCF9|nr:type II toxin-antitoxin system RelE/ParE family toxin [Photorhabdus antumapuensis]MCA6219899.1 type II toxin-antitoxin system RelE/ParE family toxin [Photorhabdus antumapuensis]